MHKVALTKDRNLNHQLPKDKNLNSLEVFATCHLYIFSYIVNV